MKKIAALTVIMVLLIGGVVGASSNWGQYHGNEIVKVSVNGVVLNPEVPAQIIDGSTLLPLRAISDALGATVSWNPYSYEIGIIPRKQNVSVSEIASSLKENHVEQVALTSDGKGYDTVEFVYGRLLNGNDADFNAMITAALSTNATMFKLTDTTTVYKVSMFNLRKFQTGEITQKTLNENYTITPK